VESASYYQLDTTAPWESDTGAGRHACFGMVSRGIAGLSLEANGQSIALAEGDAFLLSPGIAHHLRSGAGEPATIIGGRFTFDETTGRSLADLLPPLIHIRADSERNAVAEPP
jgi:hypothetical protein